MKEKTASILAAVVVLGLFLVVALGVVILFWGTVVAVILSILRWLGLW